MSAKAKQATRRTQLGLIVVGVDTKIAIDEDAQRTGRTQSQVTEALIEKALHFDTMMVEMNIAFDGIMREAKERREKGMENDRMAKIDSSLAQQLQRSIACNGRLVTALRRIKSLEPKNVEKYAQQIATEALAAVDESG